MDFSLKFVVTIPALFFSFRRSPTGGAAGGAGITQMSARKVIRFGVIGAGLMGKEFASAAARWCHLLAPGKQFKVL